MSLTTKFKQSLKAQAHKLKPVVMIGNHGVTPAVLKEIDRALNDHSLIKIRLSIADRDEKREAFTQLCETSEAEAVQLIGNIGVIYRKSDKEEEKKPKAVPPRKKAAAPRKKKRA